MRKLKWAIIAIMFMVPVLLAGCAGDEAAETGGGDYGADGDFTIDGDIDCRDTPCADDSECGEGCACDIDIGFCRAKECGKDADCIAAYGEGYTCDTSSLLCYPKTCLDHGECPDCFPCDDGRCRKPDPCETAMSIRITPGGGMTREGESLVLSVSAFDDKDEAVAIPAGTLVMWESSKPNVVAVDPLTGEITGGSDSGTAEISAHLTCTCPYLTATVEYENFDAVASGSGRVIVFDEETGGYIDGATVMLGGQISESVDGQAHFIGINCTLGCDLHVFKEGYAYLSAFGLKVNDIIAPLDPNRDLTVSSGVKGAQDISLIPEQFHDDVVVGFSGFSFSGNIADLNFKDYLGTNVRTLIDIPPFTSGYYYVATGLEVYLDGGKVPVLSGFHAATDQAVDTLWGIGGYTGLAALITALSGGGIDWGLMLSVMMPYVENFFHGLNPNVALSEIPTVQDSDDINGNNDRDELVPDFQSFSETELKLAMSQNLETTLIFNELPAMSDVEDSVCADSIVAIATARQEGVGLIPYGFNLFLDKRTDTDVPDCNVGDANDGAARIGFAQQYGAVIGGDYVFICFATDIRDLMTMKPVSDVSGVVARSPEPPEQIEMPGFLGIMEDADWNGATRTLIALPVSGTTFHKATFVLSEDPTMSPTPMERRWTIYWGPDEAGFSLADVPPGNFIDLSEEFNPRTTVQAVRLDEVSYDDLFLFNGTNLDRLDDYVEAYSSHGMWEW